MKQFVFWKQLGVVQYILYSGNRRLKQKKAQQRDPSDQESWYEAEYPVTARRSNRFIGESGDGRCLIFFQQSFLLATEMSFP